jgi:glycerol-3-phosphate acyltransferase PlsY
MLPVLWLLGDQRIAMLFLGLTVVVWIMHRANIARLLAGTEPKIGRSAPVAKA